MKIVFSALARRELEDAARYYEFQYAGLGKRFKKEVRKAALRIAKYPRSVVDRARGDQEMFASQVPLQGTLLD